MSKKILITGTNGLLGSDIYFGLNSIFDVLPTSRSRSSGINNSIFLDITNFDNLKKNVEEFKPDIIINCAAFTDVDNAEIEKEQCRNVNVVGLRNIIKSISRNTKIIHISSDYVFDGSKEVYLETDIPNPLNYYGKSKLEAENILKSSNIDYLIFRPNVLYSGNLNKNHFLSWIYKNLKNNNHIKLVEDQISNPVYIPFFIKALIDCILLDVKGVYHIGSENPISRYDFGLKVCKYYKLSKNNIEAIKTSDLKQLANRPKNSFLDCTKIVNSINYELMSNDFCIYSASIN